MSHVVRLMKPMVMRVTVDEILSVNLIRFETCALKKRVSEFFDEVESWGTKKELLINKNHYESKLNLSMPWEELKEGQVFIAGEFEVITNDKNEAEFFKVSPGKSNFLRIDNVSKFKDQVKRVYSDLLTRR